MDYLSIGAVFRMENSWLVEWLEYHRFVGVERFYLYCDEADSRVSDKILKPYVDSGLVALRWVREMDDIDQSPHAWRQPDVYREIIREATGKTEWIAMIDLDEFLLPRQCDDMRELLESYEAYSGLAVHWCIFGTSGFVRRPPTQINHLLHRGESRWARNRFVKSIVRPDRIKIGQIDNTHCFPVTSGKIVNERRQPVSDMVSENMTTDTVRLNHYILRSWQDYWEVKAGRSRSLRAGPCDESFFQKNDRNEVPDTEISERFGHIHTGG